MAATIGRITRRPVESRADRKNRRRIVQTKIWWTASRFQTLDFGLIARRPECPWKNQAWNGRGKSPAGATRSQERRAGLDTRYRTPPRPPAGARASVCPRGGGQLRVIGANPAGAQLHAVSAWRFESRFSAPHEVAASPPSQWCFLPSSSHPLRAVFGTLKKRPIHCLISLLSDVSAYGTDIA